MPAGCYLVSAYPSGAEYPTDIAFQQAAEVRGEIPEIQRNLKSEIERTLDVLRPIFLPQDPKFRGYFDELLGLARYGLVGGDAQPGQASETLKILQTRIYNREKGAVISQHMAAIMRAQVNLLLLLLVSLGVYVAGVWLVASKEAALHELALLLVVPGFTVGIAFASFLRCRAVTFYELSAIDADRFTPNMKAGFAIVVLMLTAVFLKAEFFEIVVGKIRLSAFDADWLSAVIFGVIVGIAQEPLIARIEAARNTASPPPPGGDGR